MADNSLKISYKIYLEAEDISQSRISSTASYVSNLFKNCTNSYLQKAEVDNESDMDDFTLRLYIDEKVEEEECSSPECAEGFLENIAEFLDAVAAAHSYLDMEGSFSIPTVIEVVSKLCQLNEEREKQLADLQETTMPMDLLIKLMESARNQSKDTI